jgi:ferric-dicitrate binding protein FerR (iron transport regulator)
MQNLFNKYLNNECSPAELKALLVHFNNPENEKLLRSLITENLEAENLSASADNYQMCSETELAFEAIKKQMDTPKAPVIMLIKKNWLKLAVAAILLIGTFSVYNLVINKDSVGNQTVKTKILPKQDIIPGGNKAILTLADGSQIILDSADNGSITNQGNATVIKLDGQLTYNSTGADGNTQAMFNSISTPRGGQYLLILADGSKVWLNAASSLKFPTIFVGTERTVELTGEAYFEIAPLSPKGGQKMPFKVTMAGKGEVEVLGTHFNINSYSDEAAVKTTLLEGKVKVTALSNLVSKTPDIQFLTVGQQALINTMGKITLNKDVDIDAEVAWKNGTFNFNSQNIKSILRQIGRWYDVDITYNGNVSNETFSGIVSRNSNLSQVLKIMEMAGVNFKIEGKTIVVN